MIIVVSTWMPSSIGISMCASATVLSSSPGGPQRAETFFSSISALCLSWAMPWETLRQLISGEEFMAEDHKACQSIPVALVNHISELKEPLGKNPSATQTWVREKGERFQSEMQEAQKAIL